ncbi:MAG: hypothetical protein ACLTPN_02480 [Clostridia bacterium]
MDEIIDEEFQDWLDSREETIMDYDQLLLRDMIADLKDWINGEEMDIETIKDEVSHIIEYIER